jgi:hypothetical protein
MGSGFQPRQRMHPNAATLQEGWRFAGNVLEANGVASPPETLFPREFQFHANIRPTGNLWEAQRHLHFIPGYVGGVEYRVLDAYNVEGYAFDMGYGGVGGFVPKRGGKMKRYQTRGQKKLRNKTRKMVGGAEISAEDLAKKVWQLRSYNDVNRFRFTVQTLMNGITALKTGMSQSKNQCLTI